MAKGIDLERGGGDFTKHGQIASPLQPCGYEIPSRGASSQAGAVYGGESKGKVGAHMQTPGTKVQMESYSGQAPSPGTMPAGERRLATPMDATLLGINTGTPGNASGTGAQGSGKISSPWSGPFGDIPK